MILPVTDKAMQTLRRFGAKPVRGRPGFASVPDTVVDLLLAPIAGMTTPASFTISPK